MAYPKCNECKTRMLYYHNISANEGGFADIGYGCFCPNCHPKIKERYDEINGID